MNWQRNGLLALLVLACQAVSADARYLVIVAGIGGEPYYTELFQRWATSLEDVGVRGLGLDRSNIFTLTSAAPAGAAATDAPAINRAQDEHKQRQAAPSPDAPRAGLGTTASRENILQVIEHLGTVAPSDAMIMIVLIGHGSANQNRIAFNVPGPDITPRELDQALSVFDDQQLAIINTTPSSAPFVSGLSAPNRIVVSATSTPAENHHTLFAAHWIDGLMDAGADTNKDSHISLLEVFQFARRATARAYEDDGRILTEHPLLDDNGDGKGAREPSATGPDGANADRFFFNPRTNTGTLVQEMATRRLLEHIERLKRDKNTYSSDDYFERLEQLLVELALNQRAMNQP
ncbi:MAG: hypothetical protein K0U93_13775 [Gammaproteobacteria bacterium]|nr:hypothetical protein [Gammaproteobacteria bacterium]